VNEEKNVLHECDMPESSYVVGWGTAIEKCWENEKGKLYAGNGEYGSQVNFCPICGYKAKVVIS
jgi:hypothetical protein